MGRSNGPRISLRSPHFRTRSPSIWRSAVRPMPSFIWWRWRGGADSTCRCALFDEIARHVPVLANIRPSGEFLMEDFYYAGGLRALMAEIRDLLASRLPHRERQNARRKSGRRARRESRGDSRRAKRRWSETGGTAILYGSLAPDGAVIKTVAADRRFWQHTGPAVVFDDYPRHGGAHQPRRSECD